MSGAAPFKYFAGGVNRVRSDAQRLAQSPTALWAAIVLSLSGLAVFYRLFWTGMNACSTSDSAVVLLEAQDMLHGNLLLHGWYLPSANVLTLNAPLYVLAEAFWGLQPWLMQLVPEMVFLGLLVVGLLTSFKNKPLAARWVATAYFLPIVGLQSVGRIVPWLLSGPNHTMTVAFCLAVLLIVDSTQSPPGMRRPNRPLAWLAVVLLVFLSVFGDPLALVILVLPVIAYAFNEFVGSQASRGIRWALTGILTGAAVAWVARSCLRHVGGFVCAQTLEASFIRLRETPASFMLTLAGLLKLFGARIAGLPLNLVNLFLLARVVALLVAVVAVVGTLVRWLRQKPVNRLDVFLSLSATMTVAATFLSEQGLNSGVSQVHYLVPAFVCLVIVAARSLGDWFLSGRTAARWIVILCVVLFISSRGLIAGWFRWEQEASSTTMLAHWLEQHHLHQGFGVYWDSHIITVETRQAVIVRPLADSLVAVRNWLSKKSWYDTRRHRYTFVIYDRRDPTAFPVPGRVYPLTKYGYLPPQISGAFGPPAHVYSMLHYEIAVWNHPIHFAK
ncbi:MAG: hypothetical protein HKL96_07775 [Phycisphaerales bacterium]|nr:hypothetical protein [Phycisphaerales bacterium]